MNPCLDILPAAQRALWDDLKGVPSGFILYGGTAIALYLGHRHSVDFDFFCFSHFDPDEVLLTTPFLEGARVVSKRPDTLTVFIKPDDPIQVSFFGIPGLGQIRHPTIVPDNQLRLASLLDLAGMKVAVVQKRAEAKDYIDLDALIHRASIDLATALSAGAAIYGRAFNPEITLKALCYFGDGNLPTLSRAVRDRLARAVQAVDLDCLPCLTAIGQAFQGTRPS